MRQRPCRPTRPPCDCRPHPKPPEYPFDDNWIGSLRGQLSIPRTISGGGGEGEPYTGEYEVTPKAYDEQTLPTANKTLTSDILVHAVPYYETTNNSKGLTAYIAEEV